MVLEEPRVRGPDCQDLDPRAIAIGSSAFGWSPRADGQGGTLMRWDRGRWRPFAFGVDELEPQVRIWTELPLVTGSR